MVRVTLSRLATTLTSFNLKPSKITVLGAAFMLVVALVMGPVIASGWFSDDVGIFRPFPDDSGKVQTETPFFRTLNENNKFFSAKVGTNGQACVTCHEPSDGFTLHVATIDDAFTASKGLDPIFRVVDTADRPDAVVKTLADREKAYALVQALGVIRIGKTIPATADFRIAPQDTGQFGPLPNSNDPQHPGVPSLSVFRRPLVNTNVRFDSSVLWDGRAAITDMDTQVKGAIQSLLVAPGHPPKDNPAVDHEIAKFMLGVFTDQVFDTAAGTDANGVCQIGPTCGSGDTERKGARAGIEHLIELAFSATAPCLFAVDPKDPTKLELTPLTPSTCKPNKPGYNVFNAWGHLPNEKGLNAGRASVFRGQQLFNNAVLHVPKDLQPQLGKTAHCTSCHSTRNVGNNPDPKFFIRIGTDSLNIMDALAAHDSRVNELLDRVKMLPVYCLRPNSDTADFTSAPCGTHSGDVETTDPGRALVSGKLADVGQFKPPVLRGLAARSPYFHAAAAPNIQAVVHFYNARFKIGLSEAEVNDLGAFLEDQ